MVTQCEIVSEKSLKQQIISNIQKSGQTPEEFIPKENEIDLKDWALTCDGDKIVAQGNMHSNKGDWYSCTLQKVYVDGEYRKRGLGSDVVSRLIDKGKHKKTHGFDDCQILTADIDRSNFESRNLFEKHGFEVVGSFCIPGENKKADFLRMTLSPVKGCGR